MFRAWNILTTHFHQILVHVVMLENYKKQTKNKQKNPKRNYIPVLHLGGQGHAPGRAKVAQQQPICPVWLSCLCRAKKNPNQ